MIHGGGAKAFGADAQSYATALRDLPVFVVGTDPNAAWGEMLEVRRTGEDFALMPLLDDPRASISRAAASDVYCQLSDYDLRRPFMEAIDSGDLDAGGQTLLQRSVYDPLLVRRFSDLIRLSSTLVVRSFGELQRLRTILGPIRCNVARWFPTRELPFRRRQRLDNIVLWAPEEPGAVAALACFALEQVHRDVVIVSSTPPPFRTRFAHLVPSDPSLPAMLEGAACVVDLSISDPSWAVAFALREIPVIAASTSGADEVLDGIAVYDPWSFQSIASAAASALGRGPGRLRETPPEAATILRSLEASQVRMPERAPLVTIMMPSYNRRERLERTVRDVLKQQYTNLEVLVINDGGESLSHVAEFDPRIRVIERSVNVGLPRIVNVAIQEAKGEYVEGLADDDRFYPDHVLRLVDALERTGAAVAHGNTLLCGAMTDELGAQRNIYNTERFSETVDLCETYAYHRVARFMARRSVLLELGGYAEDIFLSDLEMLIRLAERYDFVHVPVITAENWLWGKQQYSTHEVNDHGDWLRQMFERHPAPGRPYVAALRKKVLEKLGDPGSKVTGL